MAFYDTVISHRVYKPVPLSFPRKRGIQYSAAVVGALNGRHGVLNHPLSRVMTPVDAASPPLEAQLAAALWLDGYAPNTLANPA